jgi:hypothetical protein
MTTKFSKPVFRETDDVKIHDCGKKRELVCGFEPGDVVSVRMKGTRTAFKISARTLYEYAAKLHGEAERRAKQLQ